METSFSYTPIQDLFNFLRPGYFIWINAKKFCYDADAHVEHLPWSN